MSNDSNFNSKFKDIFEAFRPPPKLTCLEWIEQNISVLASTSAMPGPYRVAKTPYLKGLFDAVDDPRVRKISFPKGAQTGVTEATENILSYYIAHKPGPLMWVLPIAAIANKNAKTRLIPKIKNTPSVAEKCDFSHLGGSSNSLVMFRNGSLTITNAGSENSLRSTPAAVAIFDEVDGAKRQKEGDPVALVEERLSTFKNSKLILLSTPALKEQSLIWPQYESSDKRKFFVKCPHCRHQQTLDWENVRWSEDKPQTAKYHCPSCGAAWSERQRRKAIESGEWIATAPFTGHAGFHISQLYSLLKSNSIAAVVEKYLADKENENLVRFYNTCLGLPYSTDTATVSIDDLLSRKERFDSVSIPNDVKWLVLTVDTQGDRFECLLTGFAADHEQYLISHTVLAGIPDDPMLFAEIVALYDKPYYKQDGSILKAQVCLVDSGGHFTGQILEYCNDQMKLRKKIYPIKGLTGDMTPMWTGKPKTSNAHKKQQYFSVGVNSARQKMFSKLKVAEAGKNYIHISDSISDEAILQLRNESPAFVRRGTKMKVEWKQHGPNEMWDLSVYSIIGLFADLEGYKRACANFIPNIQVQGPKSRYLERLNNL